MPVPVAGDFGLVRSTPGGWLNHAAADIIEWDTRSPYCHAFVCIGGGKIVEAVRTVKVTDIGHYSDITWSSGIINPTPLQRKQIVAACQGMLGDRYNWADILAIALAQYHIIGAKSWLISRVSDDHMEICSQLVALAYLAAGIPLMPGTPPCLVTPGDLGHLLS